MKVKNIILKLAVLVFGIIFTFSSIFAAEFSGKIYYTKVNIWYENTNDILSTNYHRGNILPLGTKVKIHNIIGSKIQFTPEGSGQLFTIINTKKTSTISTERLFNRYFSTEVIKPGAGDYYQANEADRENIKKGIITLGMSKKAVILAYGYPPTHKTPQLSSDIWYYWYARLHKVNVYFKDDKVIKIENIGPAPYPGIIKSEVVKEGGIKEDKIKEKKVLEKEYDLDTELRQSDKK